jgi:hypothetical protein
MLWLAALSAMAGFVLLFCTWLLGYRAPLSTVLLTALGGNVLLGIALLIFALAIIGHLIDAAMRAIFG